MKFSNKKYNHNSYKIINNLNNIIKNYLLMKNIRNYKVNNNNKYNKTIINNKILIIMKKTM